MAGISWLAFPAGIAIATVGTAVGIGAGILWMPFLLIVLGLKPQVAVLTSLLIQTVGTGSGSLTCFLQHRVDHKLGLLLLAVAVPGLIVGAHLAHRLGSSPVELILGLLTLTTAFLFVTSNEKYLDTGLERVQCSGVYRYSWIALVMSVGSGMLSTSIGEWLIPVMKNKLSLKMSNAIATSVFITFGLCIMGSVLHTVMGARADLSIVGWGIPGVAIGGQLGPRIARRINDRLLKEMFIFALTLIGIHLIYHSY